MQGERSGRPGGETWREQLLRGEKGINVSLGWWVKGRGPSEGH